MYSNKLDEIQKEYASKHSCGLPLTAEQLLNAVVEWVNSNYIPSTSIDDILKQLDNINIDIENIENDKVSKVNVGFRVYATDINGDDILQGQAYSATEEAYTIMQRDSNGRSRINEPSDDSDIANKIYVDNAIVKNSVYGKKALIIGDSTAETNLTYDDWAQRLNDVCKFESLNNKAEGGISPYQFLDNVLSTDIQDANLCFIMGFFNGNFEAGTPENTDSVSSDSTLSQCYCYMIKKILKENPKIHLFILSPHSPKADDGADRVMALKNVCEYYKIPFIDVYNTCGINTFNYDEMLRDEIHCNQYGYERVFETILRKL